MDDQIAAYQKSHLFEFGSLSEPLAVDHEDGQAVVYDFSRLSLQIDPVGLAIQAGKLMLLEPKPASNLLSVVTEAGAPAFSIEVHALGFVVVAGASGLVLGAH